VANPWFRLYSEFADDPKVQMMSEELQRRLVMLFCSRCKEETLHETERAFHWRISTEDLLKTKAIFLEKGFIDDDWNLINWNRRQFLSDSSTDRVRRHRQSKKQDETLPKRSTAVTVTAPEQNRTDTESRPEQRQSNGHAPDNGSELALAAWLFEEANTPCDNSLVRVAGDCIRKLAKEAGIGYKDAADVILGAARAAIQDGEPITRFWFTDQRYKPHKPKKTDRQKRIEAWEPKLDD
jgi:hypothetical protein